MRTLLVTTLCFCVGFLFAQTADETGDVFSSGNPSANWQISLTVSPRFDKVIPLPGARIEVDPVNILPSERSLIDTIAIGGQDRVFRKPIPGSVFIDPSDANFWVGTQLRLHRRISNSFRLTFGAHYDRRRYTTRAAGGTLDENIQDIGAAILYPVSKFDVRSIGVVSFMDYHYKEDRRIHPFLGLGFSMLLVQNEFEPIRQVYSAEPTLEIPARDVDPAFLQNSFFDFDFQFNGGLLCRIARDWQVGVTISSYVGGAGVFGAHVRCGL